MHGVSKQRACIQALTDAADSPAMMVRVAVIESAVLSEFVPGKVVDGLPLQVGDYILLHTTVSHPRDTGVHLDTADKFQ